MISIGRFLNKSKAESKPKAESEEAGNGLRSAERLASALRDALRGTLGAAGAAAENAAPVRGGELQQQLARLAAELCVELSPAKAFGIGGRAAGLLRDWSGAAARQALRQAEEVKSLLLALARAAEGAGERDRRCSECIEAVTGQLESIVRLDDLDAIRASVLESAAGLKSGIRAIMEDSSTERNELRAELDACRERLAAAERMAAVDGLTQLYNRHHIECEIERRIAAGAPFCIGILDLDGFKTINDSHGHAAGDEILRLFAAGVRSACRTGDVVGRWGGDELILLMDCGLAEAGGRIERLRASVCRNYIVEGRQMRVEASIGVAEYQQGEEMRDLFARADSAMYRLKALRVEAFS
jgi:diguanylate cyclase (GGDEF)-like protein